MLPFDDYLFDEDGNRVVLKLVRETPAPEIYGPMDRTIRDLREDRMERQRRTLREFCPESTIDPTNMQTGEVPPMVNFPNVETVTIRINNFLRIYVPRTEVGTSLGKLIRMAAINDLLDIQAIQILGCLQDPRGSSLTPESLMWTESVLKSYLNSKIAGGADSTDSAILDFNFDFD